MQTTARCWVQHLMVWPASPTSLTTKLLPISSRRALHNISRLIRFMIFCFAVLQQVLRQLVSDDRLPPELQAHCLLTVCKVLGGQVCSSCSGMHIGCCN
jgi:hypothetical protein